MPTNHNSHLMRYKRFNLLNFIIYLLKMSSTYFVDVLYHHEFEMLVEKIFGSCFGSLRSWWSFDKAGLWRFPRYEIWVAIYHYPEKYDLEPLLVSSASRSFGGKGCHPLLEAATWSSRICKFLRNFLRMRAESQFVPTWSTRVIVVIYPYTSKPKICQPINAKASKP